MSSISYWTSETKPQALISAEVGLVLIHPTVDSLSCRPLVCKFCECHRLFIHSSLSVIFIRFIRCCTTIIYHLFNLWFFYFQLYLYLYVLFGVVYRFILGLFFNLVCKLLWTQKEKCHVSMLSSVLFYFSYPITKVFFYNLKCFMQKEMFQLKCFKCNMFRLVIYILPWHKDLYAVVNANLVLNVFPSPAALLRLTKDKAWMLFGTIF